MTSYRKALIASVFSIGLLGAGGASAQQPQAEVLHWWTSGGEARAAQALKEDFEANGGTWIDAPVAGGGGDAAMTVLRSRVLSGDAPTAVQLKGPAIAEWAEQGALSDLSTVAAEENWDSKVPVVLQSVMKYDDTYVAVPVNIHRVNWLWVNPDALAKVGADVPKTWDEFNATAAKLKDAGIIPLAHGGQPWQDATVFEAVVLGLGGPEFYREAIVDLDEEALSSDTMVRVFDQMRTIRNFLDPDFSGRDWNLATAMVMNGQAAMQIMGDWAKGEFVAAGKTPGEDFLCAEVPGEEAYALNTDSFAMFKQNDPAKQDGQVLLARLVLGDKFQKTFNLAKGSIPASTTVDLSDFDSCAQKSKADLIAAQDHDALVLSFAHKMALRGHLEGAIVDVVTNHFNSDMSSQEAVDRLVEAIELAKM